MDPPSNDIFKDYIDPILEQAWDWLGGHPQFASLALLISSLVPFIPFQAFQAYVAQLPSEANTCLSAAVGYTPDGDVRPGSLASRFPSAFSERMAMLPPDRRFQSYTAIQDARRSLEEGGGRGGDDDDDDDDDEDGECCSGCCRGPRKAIKYTRWFVQAWLFVSAVVVFVGSLKEGKEGGNR